MNIPDYTVYKEYFNTIGKSKDNIIIINNFLEKNDIKLIFNFLESEKNDIEFRGGSDKRYEEVVLKNPEVAKLLLKYQNLIWLEIKKNFVEKYNIKVCENPWNSLHFVKWIEGMSSKLHSDCERPDGTPAFHANFYKLNLSALCYPNDNYDGGEITFPDYNISLKPKAGDLIIFPSNGFYKHTVEKIKSGIRYTMPTWFTFDIPGETFTGEYNYDDSYILFVDEGKDRSDILTK